MQQNIPRSILTAAIALTLSPAAFAQTLLVHIVQRQDTKTELTAAIPDRADTKDDKSSSGDKKPAGGEQERQERGGPTRGRKPVATP